MCGISVAFAPRSSVEVTQAALRMHVPIRHRGPDGEGFALINEGGTARYDDLAAIPAGAAASVAFAFRRLKIVDLTDAASQPMASRDGRFWVVFNGEIYNFRDLRQELMGDGSSFVTTGDTEVILAAFEKWGTECFKRFEGMWSIVIADIGRRRLIASRDRFGIKPLYYSRDGDTLLLASEIRQLLAAHTSRPQANARLLGTFLRGDRASVLEETFFDGVRSVPPGSWFEVPFGEPLPRDLPFRYYWDLASVVEGGVFSYDDAVDRLGALMTSAVKRHSVADVRVGSLLSGGLDSSTIASLLVSQLRPESRSVPTFSFGYRSAAPEFCELQYVDALVNRDHLENHETSMTPEWVARNAANVVSSLEEPPLAMPVFAQYRTFELCRQHDTTVVLDGQGADEIFAGYTYHERLLLMDDLQHGRVRAMAREATAIASRDSISTPRLLLKAIAQPYVQTIADAVRGRSRWMRGVTRGAASPDLRQAESEKGGQRSLVNRRLLHDVKWGNAKIILGYADKNAMQFSIESRVPYFDRALVEFAFTLPAEFKVGQGTRKRVLRDFARRFLPPAITGRRDRMGFATPDAAWIRGPLWPAVQEAIRDPSFMSGAFFDRQALERFISGFERGEHGDARAIWRLWMMSVWQQAFGVSASDDH